MRACAECETSTNLLTLGDAHAVVFYTEDDRHFWDERRRIVVCGGATLPSSEELQEVKWDRGVLWSTIDRDFYLMNSAVDTSKPPPKDEHALVRLAPGTYRMRVVTLVGAGFIA